VSHTNKHTHTTVTVTHVRNVVDNDAKKERDDKRVGSDSTRVGKLIPELNIVVVDPPGSNGDTVQAGYTRVGEDASQKGTDEASHSVESKHVKSIVDLLLINEKFRQLSLNSCWPK
jgi:hypothetical protein